MVRKLKDVPERCNKMKCLVFIISSLLIVTNACGSKKSDSSDSADPTDTYLASYADKTADGLVDGKAWSLNTVEVFKSLSGDGEYEFRFYSSAPKDEFSGSEVSCNHLASGADSVSIVFSAPLTAGEHVLGADASGVIQTMTFSFKKSGSGNYSNLATDRGKLLIDSIADGVVKGKIAGYFDANNHVNGTFTAKVCE